MDGRPIKLDVGGTVFKTSAFTLSQHDSMLKTMVSTEVPVVLDEEGCIFIDRDPRHFRIILNFLRDGYVELPDDRREIIEILAEAKYFLLQPLIEMCQLKLSQTDFSTLNYHIATYVVDARKFIFASEKPVIVLRLPVYLGTSGGVNSYYFSEQRFLELAEKYHRIITFVLVTEPEFNEDCSWSFFLKTKKRTVRVKGPSDDNMLQDCMISVLDDVKLRTKRV